MSHITLDSTLNNAPDVNTFSGVPYNLRQLLEQYTPLTNIPRLIPPVILELRKRNKQREVLDKTEPYLASSEDLRAHGGSSQEVRKMVFPYDSRFRISTYWDPAGFFHLVSFARRNKGELPVNLFLGVPRERNIQHPAG